MPVLFNPFTGRPDFKNTVAAPPFTNALNPDGSTDNMALLAAGITDAVNSGLNSLFVPAGTYNFVAKRLAADRVVIPENFTLYGVAGATIFKVDPTSYSGLTAGQAVGILRVRNGSRVEGIVFDGQKALVNGGAVTNYGGCFINRYDDNVNDVMIMDVECKNNPGGSAYESFCVQTGFLSKRWKFYRVNCHDNNGTGISINGDLTNEYNAAGAGLPADMDVVDCRGVDNYWQGATIYAARDIRVLNFVGTGNGNVAIFGGNGLNVEWATNVDVQGGLFEMNKGGGVGGYGCVEKLKIGNGATLRNNNQLNQSDLGEIVFKGGSWYDGPGGVTFKGGLQSLYVDDTVSVTPKSSGWRCHAMIGYNANANWVFGVASGGSYPASVGTHPQDIVVRGLDADNWIFGIHGLVNYTSLKPLDFLPCGVTFPDVPVSGPNWAPPVGGWTAATMSVATRLGGASGARYRLTSGSAAGTYAAAAVALTCPRWFPAGQKFRVRVRYRNNNADMGWNFCIRPAAYDGTTYGYRQFNLNLYALDTNWRTSEMIVTMPVTSIAQPKIYYCGTNASATLDLEFSIAPIHAGVPLVQTQVVGGIKTTWIASGNPIDDDYEAGDRIFAPGADVRVTAAGSYGAVSGSTTLSITGSQNQGTLSVDDETFRPGKYITIPGAGAGGVDTVKLIRYRSGTTISFSSAVNTTVTNVVCTVSNPTTTAA